MKDEELIVTHIETGEIISAHKTGDKWRIVTEGKSKYRYFTDEQIATAELRRKLAAIPIVYFRPMFMDKSCPSCELSGNNRSKNA